MERIYVFFYHRIVSHDELSALIINVVCIVASQMLPHSGMNFSFVKTFCGTIYGIHIQLLRKCILSYKTNHFTLQNLLYSFALESFFKEILTTTVPNLVKGMFSYFLSLPSVSLFNEFKARTCFADSKIPYS